MESFWFCQKVKRHKFVPKALGRGKWGGIIVDKPCLCVIFVPTENKRIKKCQMTL